MSSGAGGEEGIDGKGVTRGREWVRLAHCFGDFHTVLADADDALGTKGLHRPHPAHCAQSGGEGKGRSKGSTSGCTSAVEGKSSRRERLDECNWRAGYRHEPVIFVCWTWNCVPCGCLHELESMIAVRRATELSVEDTCHGDALTAIHASD